MRKLEHSNSLYQFYYASPRPVALHNNSVKMKLMLMHNLQVHKIQSTCLSLSRSLFFLFYPFIDFFSCNKNPEGSIMLWCDFDVWFYFANLCYFYQFFYLDLIDFIFNDFCSFCWFLFFNIIIIVININIAKFIVFGHMVRSGAFILFTRIGIRLYNTNISGRSNHLYKS